MNMADRIQYLRKSKGISQEELADKARLAAKLDCPVRQRCGRGTGRIRGFFDYDIKLSKIF